MAERLTKIDDLTRPDHYFLGPEDKCYYIGEYTSRAGYVCSKTNNIVQNFKKPVDRKGLSEYYYKGTAISEIASTFRALINDKWIKEATLVPIPPSKAKNDPLYDDRLVQLLHKMCQGLNADIRELVLQRESLPAAHESSNRHSPDDLLEQYYIDDESAEPTPLVVGLFDDVLTTGAHYTAAKRLLSVRFPDISIIGLFYARRVPNEPSFEDIFPPF